MNARNTLALKKIRDKIDVLDSSIALLLEKRFMLAIETKSFKKKIINKKREFQVLKNAVRKVKNKGLSPLIKNIYIEIIKNSIKWQKKNADKTEK